MKRSMLTAVVVASAMAGAATVPLLRGTATASAQQRACLHEQGETPEQTARRTGALTSTRTINNIQANRPEARSGLYLRQAELASAPFAAGLRESTSDTVRRISLNPAEDILPGWKLTLDAMDNGYWFMIKDTTDPCGFTYISNQNGVIYNGAPIR